MDPRKLSILAPFVDGLRNDKAFEGVIISYDRKFGRIRRVTPISIDSKSSEFDVLIAIHENADKKSSVETWFESRLNPELNVSLDFLLCDLYCQIPIIELFSKDVSASVYLETHFGVIERLMGKIFLLYFILFG